MDLCLSTSLVSLKYNEFYLAIEIEKLNVLLGYL